MKTFEALRVLELAEGVAGPVCGLQLADLGASIIKLEPPGGDRSREWGPPADAAIFAHLNRGKRSVVLDPRTPAGRAALERLLPGVDVVVVQMDPPERQEAGIDWMAMCDHHRHLVVCEIDDLGWRGPLADLPGSELTVQALSGFTRYLGPCGGEPRRVGFEIAWMAAGMHAYQAVVAALYGRKRTGEGQLVRISTLGALLALKSILLAAQSDADAWNGFHLLGPGWPVDTGWTTRDGQVTFDFRHGERDRWVTFCRKVGLEHLPDDPDYADWRSTIYIGDRRHTFGRVYQPVFAAMSSAEASGLINDLGGISVKFHDYAEVFAHPQVQLLEPLVVAGDGPGASRQLGSPFRVGGEPPRRRMRPAPALGEATDEVLRGPVTPRQAAAVRPSGTTPLLAGLKVLDASMGAVGPWAGVLLGQLGADVVKLESPQGDFIRNVMPTKRGLGTTYIASNFNKRGVVLDLKDPAQRAQAHELARRADVFIENFRPGVADRIGVGYAELTRLNPRLVYASASGFGQHGPMAGIGAADPHIQAFTGSTSVNGIPGGPRERWRWYGHFDCTTALCVAQGILTALLEREETGQGRRVEVTMVEAALALQRVRIAEHLSGGHPRPMGSATTYLVPDQAFATQDRPVAVSVTSRRQWRAFCAALGRPALAEDPRFASNPLRLQYRDTLVPLLEQRFREGPAAYWLKVLRQAQVPCALFTSFDDFRYHVHYLENEMLVTFNTPQWGRLVMGGIPWRFTRTPASLRPGPLPGEHTEAIVRGGWPDLPAGAPEARS